MKSDEIEKRVSEAEEVMVNLDGMMKSRVEDAEEKIKKGTLQGAIWIFVTIAIYLIWGTTWFFWVSLGLNLIAVGGIVFAKVMIGRVKKKMSEGGEPTDYDFDADILDEDFVTEIEIKLFGKQNYSYADGLDLDAIRVEFNGRATQLRGTIFDGLNRLQIQKAVTLLENLEMLDAKARKKWIKLLEEEDEEVCGYIDTHYDEYGDEVRDLVLQKLKVEKRDNRAFIENLELGSFHITEGEEEDGVEIVMDYALIWENGSSFTDQILAMNFNDELAYEMHTHDS